MEGCLEEVTFKDEGIGSGSGENLKHRGRVRAGLQGLE